MRKLIYSSLAIFAAIWGFTYSKAENYRANNYFKYIGPHSIATPSSAVTTLSNWTLTTNDPDITCAGSQFACGILTNSLNLQNITLAGQTRHIPLKVYRSGRAATVGVSGNIQVIAAYNDDLF